MLMLLNDIRVPGAIFIDISEPYIGKIYITLIECNETLRVPPGATIKNTRILPSRCRKYRLRLKNSKIFQGEHNPGPPNAHVLFLRKMSMFVGPLTARQINNFFHIYRSRPYNKCCGLSVVAITVFGAEKDRNAILNYSNYSNFPWGGGGNQAPEPLF